MLQHEIRKFVSPADRLPYVTESFLLEADFATRLLDELGSRKIQFDISGAERVAFRV